MQRLNKLFREIIPALVIFSVLLFAGSVSFAFAPKSAHTIAADEPRVVETVKEEVGFSPLSKHSPQTKQVLGIAAKVVLNSSTPSFTPKASVLPSPSSVPTSVPVQTIVVRNVTEVVNTPAPTSTATPAPSIEPSPTPTPLTVNIEVNSPAGKSNFSLKITDGMNACEILQKAKDEGKIASLTLDDKYLESFGTLLVAEMNGYSTNWVFTVNGESPMGCSLSFPKSGDQIVWTYLTSF